MAELALGLLVCTLAISIINTCLMLSTRDNHEDLIDKFDFQTKCNEIFRHELERLVNSHNLKKWEQAEKINDRLEDINSVLHRVVMYSENASVKISHIFQKENNSSKPEPKKLNWRQKKKLNEAAKAGAKK